MASTFCNLSPGSGLKKLNEHFLHQNITGERSSTVTSSNNLGTKSRVFHNIQRFFNKNHRRRERVNQRSHCLQASIKSGADRFDTNTYEEVKEDEISRTTLLWRAIKFPIYSVALVPLTVGSSAAYLLTGIFYAKRYFVILASSILIITWLNLSNDVYDFDTGADKDKKESVVNIVGSRTGTLIAACSLLLFGFTGLAWASVEAGNSRSILLLACAVICGYIYQCPPFRLSYQGLGEPLCFAAFGPFATTAFYLMQTSTSGLYSLPISGTILSSSILVGITTTLILFCSHFHQIEGDEAVAKMSPLVRIGTKTGSRVVKVATITLYSLLLVLGLFRKLPITCIILCALTLPVGKLVVSYVEENHNDKKKMFMAKYYCVRLHALFGAALAAGLILARTWQPPLFLSSFPSM